MVGRAAVAMAAVLGLSQAPLPAAPLPEPLALADALALADGDHPDLGLARAERLAAEAARAEAGSRSATRLTLEGRLGAVQPSNRSREAGSLDDGLGLGLRRQLYDSGRSEALESAAELEVQGREWAYLERRQARRLEIMERFFDVLTADLEFVRDNEAMSIAFVRLERARDRNQLGQLSDVELLAQESAYQQARRRRRTSEARQRATRSRLAIALGRPGELPSELVTPPAPPMDRPRPDLEALRRRVLADSPRLRALRARLGAARRALVAARAFGRPRIDAEAGVSWYSRTTGRSYPAEARLLLEVPLLTGGERDAGIAAAQARLDQRRAELAEAELELRQRVLDLWLESDTLRVSLEALETEDAFRELSLDRSRALYELEVNADLGDAMVQTSRVRLEKARVQFRWLLVQAELDALQGRLLPVAAPEGATGGTEP